MPLGLVARAKNRAITRNLKQNYVIMIHLCGKRDKTGAYADISGVSVLFYFFGAGYNYTHKDTITHRAAPFYRAACGGVPLRERERKDE